MAIQTRPQFYELETGIDSTQITRMSRTVSNYTGMSVQPNKAIVGANAFAHEAGIHQDGMLKEKSTYEIMTPETVGLNKSNLVLGKHSGRHALKVRLNELGYEVEDDELKKIFKRFKNLADKKKIITDADLEALAEDQVYQVKDLYRLDGLQVSSGTMGLPTATVRMLGPNGELHTKVSLGTGPVDAVYKAIDEIVQMPNTLLEFHIDAVTEGIDAIGEVTVRLKPKNGSIAKRISPQSEMERRRTFGGYGAHTDIIVASARAYIAGLNKLLTASGRFGEAEVASEVGV
jgi:2-isopropylmalate synthase